ncbi:RluA family pseudouridine synthase, partial [Burkholderia territorii]
ARGKRSVAPLPGGFARQALHAWRLGLVHPVTGKTMQWRCPLPDDMNELVAALGFGQGDEEFDDDGVYDDDDFAGEYQDHDDDYDDEEE